MAPGQARVVIGARGVKNAAVGSVVMAGASMLAKMESAMKVRPVSPSIPNRFAVRLARGLKRQSVAVVQIVVRVFVGGVDAATPASTASAITTGCVFGTRPSICVSGDAFRQPIAAKPDSVCPAISRESA